MVNIILKSDAAGGEWSASAGLTGEGDGESWSTGGHIGFGLGDGGHLTLAAEARRQAATNRALVDQRFDRVTYRIGDPQASIQSASFDAAIPVGAFETYGFGTLTHKVSNNAAGFSVPGFSPVWPNGFLPVIEPTIWDAGATAGARGPIAGFQTDLSLTYGSSEADFEVYNTANVTLGGASPTRFDSGGATYRQWVTDLVLSRPLDGVLAGGNLAAGAQFRHESYAIRNGEPDAYAGLGADGFAGFNPRTFAAAWLLPRLPALRREADIDVELIMTRDFEALRSGEAQIGIWGAKPAPDDLIAETLFEVTAVPVCAAWLADGRSPPTGDSLDGYPLVAVRHPPTLWDGWLRDPACDVRTYDTLHMMYEAAAAGLGVALAVPLLAEPFLADGRLRRCGGEARPLNAAYRLYRSGRRRVQSAPERAFTTWLRREVTKSIDAFDMLTACPLSGQSEQLTAIRAL